MLPGIGNYKNFNIVLTAVVIFTVINISCFSREPELETIIINKVEILVETAVTDKEKSTGLMHRKNLEHNRGMLFIYSNDQRLSFWMKNTYIPLSIAFIASDGTIREILDMEPHSLNPVTSSRSVRYALEVNRGFFEENLIKPGDRVILPESISR